MGAREEETEEELEKGGCKTLLMGWDRVGSSGGSALRC